MTGANILRHVGLDRIPQPFPLRLVTERRPFNPKSEFRIPETRKKPEIRRPKTTAALGRKKVRDRPPGHAALSGIGLRISFGSRISDFGFRVERSPASRARPINPHRRPARARAVAFFDHDRPISPATKAISGSDRPFSSTATAFSTADRPFSAADFKSAAEKGPSARQKDLSGTEKGSSAVERAVAA